MRFAYNPIVNNLDLVGVTGPSGGGTPGNIPEFDADGNLVDSGFSFPITVDGGGTGLATLTPYSVLTGGTTATGNLQQVAALGAAGEVLTSNGAGSLPSWQAGGGGGDVVGPAGALDGDIALFDGATGKLIKDAGFGFPLSASNGGTGSTGFTAGSVIFSDGTNLTQDNSNFFYDNTNNRLGIGTNTPLDTLHVVDGMELDHVAAQNDDHALEIVCNANGFSDVKAVDIDYITGAMGAGADEEAILVNIDETASVGGIVAGYLVLTTAEGSATVNGYETGINVNPIVQESGTFGNADNILNIAVDVTAALASGGAGNITMFVADNDTITIGFSSKFGEMEIIIDTPASGAGIAPTFQYSTGGAGFSAFSPADGTNGFRNTGSLLWDATTLAGWVVNASGRFEIRITRTRNTLVTKPIVDEIQIAVLTEFKWDKSGDVNVNSLTLVTPLAVSDGGTGVNSLTNHGVVIGQAASAVAVTAAGTSGQILQSGGAGADPAYTTATYPATSASGDFIYASASNTYSNLTISTDIGIQLISTGSLPQWLNPKTDLFILDDFVSGSNSGNTGFITNNQNGGSTATTGVQGRIGVVQLNTGANTNGANGLSHGSTVGVTDGRVLINFLAKIVTLSDGTDTYTIWMGFINQGTATAEPINGCYFAYTHSVNGGAWVIKTANNSTRTTANTTSTVDTNWHLYTIDVNAGGTSVSFYIDGAQVTNSPIVTNLPDNTRFMSDGWQIAKSAGTNVRLLQVDFSSIWKKLTSNRY